MQMHWMGSLQRGCQGPRCSHLTEVKEAQALQGQYSTGNPKALGTAAALGQNRQLLQGGWQEPCHG